MESKIWLWEIKSVATAKSLVETLIQKVEYHFALSPSPFMFSSAILPIKK